MITIRKAKKQDAQAVWDLRTAAIRCQCKGHYSAEDLAIWTAGTMTEPFAEAVSNTFHVATMDERVVATAAIDLEAGKVDAIFVAPEHMRTGIGRQVLLYLEGLAFRAGLTRLSLESTLNAAPFYRACGFAGDQIGRYESPRGIVLDCVLMTKRLCGTK